MAKIAKITDGTLDVDLIATSAPGITGIAGGFGMTALNPLAFERAGIMPEEIRITERWQLLVRGSSHDNAATQVNALIDLLRKAWRYHNDPRYSKPVYLEWKTDDETGTRRATVYDSPEMALPDLLNDPFAFADLIARVGLRMTRSVWRSGTPGVKGTAVTLTASDGPATPEIVHIANHQDNHAISVIKSWNGGYSANLIATAAHDLFATPQNGDIYYIGSTEPVFHVVWNIGTAGEYDALTVTYEYSNGAAGWPDMTLGDDLSLYPDIDPWNQTGQVVLNWAGATDWAAENVDGDTIFWIRLRITAATNLTVSPANAADVVYNQRKPYIEIPSTALKGNVSPFLMFRYRSPAGGDDNPEMTTVSRLIMGSKSRGLAKFQSHLNCGGDGNPADWTVSVSDPPCKDASIVADETCPGGDRVQVSFASDETMVTRVQLTGANILDSWVGLYRVFLRCQQVGGDPGDIEVRLRTFINAADDYAPKIDSPDDVALKGVDNGFEIIDLFPNAVLQLPFTAIVDADDLTNADLIFHIQAKRTTGSATLQVIDLILIPADEYCTALADPLSDELTGNSALRGLTILDDDSGVIADRTVKQLIEGSYVYPAETWGRRGGPPLLEPSLQTRIYFLFCHYPSGGDWGDEPLIGTLGMHLAFELFAHNAWLFMRGSG